MTVTFRLHPSKSYPAIVKALLRNNNQWMSYKELAEATGLSMHTVYYHVNSGRARYFDHQIKSNQHPRNFFRLSALGLQQAGKA